MRTGAEAIQGDEGRVARARRADDLAARTRRRASGTSLERSHVR